VSAARGFQVGGPIRRCLGWCLVVAAIAAVAWSRRLDWGMAPVIWVPALVLLVVGWGLKTTRRLELTANRLHLIGQGLLARRRELAVGPDAELEIVPTAGLRAVVLHQGEQSLPLASWLGARRAAALAEWLDSALGRQLPRREHQPHRLDV
jgi:hypothetical protein